MVGKGRHPILGVWSPDPVLSLLAPMGLGLSVGTALVVDLTTPARNAGRTLADLVAEGPTLPELSPGRSGVAFLPGGNVDLESAFELVGQLAGHWPAIAVRVPAMGAPVATVPVIPLFPSRFMPFAIPHHGVWQPVGGGAEPPGPGPVLPRLRPGVVRRLLSGHLPRRSRWIDAWRPIWEMPWA